MQLHFNRAAASYEAEAHIQKQMADALIQDLKSLNLCFQYGREYGAGTGYLSRLLLEHFPQSQWEISDLSPSMVEWNQEHLPPCFQHRVQYSVLDLRDWQPNPHLQFIVSNATLQWIPELLQWCEQILQRSSPGITLAFTLFGPQNLAEIYQSYDQALGRPLHNPIQHWQESQLQENLQTQGWKILKLNSKAYTQSAASLWDLLRNFRATGISPGQGRKPLSRQELIRWQNLYQQKYSCPQGVYCTWDTLTVIVQKP